MGVPFEALIPYVIMTAMFGVTVCILHENYDSFAKQLNRGLAWPQSNGSETMESNQEDN
jgi:hypothetical protein